MSDKTDARLTFADSVLASTAAVFYTGSVWAGLALFFAISAVRP